MPSSRSQSSWWPLALLGTLLFALFVPREKNKDTTESVHPQKTPYEKPKQVNSLISTDVPPSPPQCKYPEGGKEHTPTWKKVVEITLAVSTAGLLLVNVFLWVSTNTAATAAKDSAKATQDQVAAFEKIEGAQLGIGHYQGDARSGFIGIPINNYGHTSSPQLWLYPHVYRFGSKDHKVLYVKDYSFGGDQTEIPPGNGVYGVVIPLELKAGEFERIGKEEVMWVAVSYKFDDGFGHISPMKAACFSYNPKNPVNWDACPTFDYAHLPK